MKDILTRAKNYLAKLPPAISGSDGHPATFKAGLALTKGFNLTPEQALPLMLEWNENCAPPWTKAELEHKLADAAKSTKPSGYLFQEKDTAPAKRDLTPAEKRTHLWPAFRKPAPEDLATIAALRGVSPEAAHLMTIHRHLWRCRWRDAECLAIRSGTFTQVRRLDGQPFPKRDGKPVKALNLPGSEGSFLNPGGMGNLDVPVILTEGAVSILESTESILRADATTGTLHSVAILAAVSASSRFTTGLLRKLAGRRVRIIADNDHAGQEAAANWTASLRAAGCNVDAATMPAGSKDLGDALRAIPATDSLWHQLLTF